MGGSARFGSGLGMESDDRESGSSVPIRGGILESGRSGHALRGCQLGVLAGEKAAVRRQSIPAVFARAATLGHVGRCRHRADARPNRREDQGGRREAADSSPDAHHFNVTTRVAPPSTCSPSTSKRPCFICRVRLANDVRTLLLAAHAVSKTKTIPRLPFEGCCQPFPIVPTTFRHESHPGGPAVAAAR